jgi:hypothetical protein
MSVIRRGATWVYRILTVIWFLGAIAQFFLAGAGVFGMKVGEKLEDQNSWDPHRAVGSLLWMGGLLIFLIVLIAWPDKKVIGMYGLFLVFDIIQDPLAWAGEDSRWVGAFHPLNGLILLGLSGTLAVRAIRGMRGGAGPEPAPSVAAG